MSLTLCLQIFPRYVLSPNLVSIHPSPKSRYLLRITAIARTKTRMEIYISSNKHCILKDRLTFCVPTVYLLDKARNSAHQGRRINSFRPRRACTLIYICEDIVNKVQRHSRLVVFIKMEDQFDITTH